MREGTAERGGEGGMPREGRRLMMKRESEVHTAGRALTEAM